jgi:hypothetical protein
MTDWLFFLFFNPGLFQQSAARVVVSLTDWDVGYLNLAMLGGI